jgi:PAS domain-containing protein
MSHEKDNLTPQERAIREKAEEILAKTKPAIKDTETDKVLHELHVHQIELEMQNEELRQTQIALEHAEAYYRDLYDFAPVGYLTLSLDGIINELNHTAANLLGIERSKIIQQRFVKFIPDDYKDVWCRHFQQAKEHFRCTRLRTPL